MSLYFATVMSDDREGGEVYCITNAVNSLYEFVAQINSEIEEVGLENDMADEDVINWLSESEDGEYILSLVDLTKGKVVFEIDSE